MISPEYELLQLSLHINDISGRDTRTRELISAHDINWSLLYGLADFHKVKPQLAGLFSGSVYEMAPAGFTSSLEDGCRQNLTDQLGHVSEFFRVARRLAEVGITVVPFKGFWLAEKYYGNLAARESDDIDVFVRYADLVKIRSIMPDTGYRIGTPYLQEVNRRDCEFNYGLYSGGRCISHIEFHWRMAPSGFGLDITLDDLAGCIVNSEVQGQPLPVFDPSATLLLTVMHHGGKDAFASLKQVNDIAVILRREEEIDWQWLMDEARRFGCMSLVAVSASLASLVTGVPVPDYLRAEAGSERTRRLADNRFRYLSVQPDKRRKFRFQVHDWLFRIRSRDGLAVKLKLLMRFIRKVFIPWIIPKRFHYLFMRKYVTPDYAQEI